MEHVGVGLRAVAALIDMVLVGIVGYAFAAVFGGATATGFNLQGLPFLLWLVVSIGYFAVLENKAQWIAEKVEGAPPNYVIDTTELKAKKGSNDVTFSFSKPTAGLPVGTYRAELFVDGKLSEKVSFSVAK